MENFRRIITAKNDQQRSFIAIDGPPSQQITWGDGAGLYEIWTESGAMNNDSAIPAELDLLTLCPPIGGFKVRWFTIMPKDTNVSQEADVKMTAEAFAMMGASDRQPDTSRHPGMHETPTIDTIILISGRVRLLLDEGDRLLSPGDVVIQRGTNHAWVAEGDEPAVLVAVLIDRSLD
tara:strand:+ start:4841 stop:5371 length:531 start_codon:yes stop_codon:yes gene_type:complete